MVDASAAASWLFASQRTEAAVEFLGRRDEYDFIAPDIFSWEIMNLISGQSRRGRIDFVDTLGLLEDFDIQIDPARSPTDIGWLAEQSVRLQLSVFDAAYLVLTIASDAELVSRDRRLLDAAFSHGLRCHDLNDPLPL